MLELAEHHGYNIPLKILYLSPEESAIHRANLKIDLDNLDESVYDSNIKTTQE